MLHYGKAERSVTLKLLFIATTFFILLSACDLLSLPGGGDDNSDSEPQETALFGTYDSWTYISGSGWTKVPGNQLIIGTASLQLSGVTIFPATGATEQELGIKDGQIWIKATVNNTTQTVSCLDYFLQDDTAYGTKILWIKSDTTATATLTAAPDPSTATANSILCFVPVGSTPIEAPPATKSLYAFGMAGSSFDDFDAYYWKDNVPTKLVRPAGAQGAFALQMSVVGSDTYITGSTQYEGSMVFDGYWKNGVWKSMSGFKFNYGEGSFSTQKAIFTENDIYLVGTKNFEGGYYHNGVWHKLVGRTDTDATYPISIVVDNGDVYIVGACLGSSDTVACYWKNNALVLLGEVNGQSNSAYTSGISINGTDVYVSGQVKKTDNSYVAGWWKNGTWTKTIKTSASSSVVSSNIIKTASSIYCGYVVMGITTMDSGYSYYDAINSSYKAKILPMDSSRYPALTSMTVDGSDIYASGVYVDTSTETYFGGYWKNGEWYEIALPDSSLTHSFVCSVMCK